jgi:hypothetical protein
MLCFFDHVCVSIHIENVFCVYYFTRVCLHPAIAYLHLFDSTGCGLYVLNSALGWYLAGDKELLARWELRIILFF